MFILCRVCEARRAWSLQTSRVISHFTPSLPRVINSLLYVYDLSTYSTSVVASHFLLARTVSAKTHENKRQSSSAVDCKRSSSSITPIGFSLGHMYCIYTNIYIHMHRLADYASLLFIVGISSYSALKAGFPLKEIKGFSVSPSVAFNDSHSITGISPGIFD